MQAIKQLSHFVFGVGLLGAVFWGCVQKEAEWSGNGGTKAKGFNESFNDLDAFNQGITSNIG